MTSLWQRVPVIVRAILVGLLVNEVGQLGAVFIFPNLKFLEVAIFLVFAAAALPAFRKLAEVTCQLREHRDALR